ncbi:dehydrodolichyl diphosphate synthase complex subunit DHDDS-like [Ciona intestinalis]
MALVCKERLPWYHRLYSSILKVGPIPKHLAFIMDGNRRYAVKKHVERIEGHSQGFDKLAEVLQWCQELGVEEVTVYAFSAENFKRSKEEVNSLMELARTKFERILKEKDKLEELGVRLCVVGELDMLPDSLQTLAKQLITTTKNNYKCKLNVCAAYTSRLEMTQAVRDIKWGVDEGLIHVSDISERLMDKTLQVPKVDLLIRTSGEVRLSDFLLWQSSLSYLSFLRHLWPEMTIWDFYGAILLYQQSYKYKKQQEEEHEEEMREDELMMVSDEINQEEALKMRKNRINNFIIKLNEKRLANCMNDS